MRIVMTHPERTSAEEFRQYVPGDLISVGGGQAWKNLLVEIHRPGCCGADGRLGSFGDGAI
jgi:hypothetical protein